ncbi:succinylglutamate desuccinylase [Reinekea marinisedimentorum]|uniref:Succinylglutamate desuccinylase n=2 Tax=Reinekea marinisedimentorum TaxID=230495 RepID=A0A4R3I3J9_9GAMM|nr:succinylglutamate desuccinylase [Reinekea marinisedimentorum]
MFSPHKDFLAHTLANAGAEHSASHSILSAGTEVTFLDTGIIRFEPNTAATTSLVISCGVHGNETAPIEIVNKIISDLLDEEQKCTQRVLFIFGNPLAMVAGERFVDINMNRLFCGDWQHNDLTLPEVKRAAKLEAYVANFFAEEPVTVTQRLHCDCHTAIRESARQKFAVYPFVEGRELPQSQQDFLAQAQVNTVLLQRKPANTFSSFTSLKQQAESFTLELGKARPFGENNLREFTGIDNTLRKLIAGEPLPTCMEGAVEAFEVCHEVNRSSEAWQFFIADDVANFTEFKTGALIEQDGEREYRVGDAPEYIVFPNPKVPVGHRAGLMLKKVGL